MPTRRDFYGFRMYIQELEQKLSQYQILEEKIKAPTTSVISAMPKNQNSTNRLEYMLNKRMELSQKITKLKHKIASEKSILDAAMECLNVSERTVLESRYFLLYSWEEIAAIIFEAYPDFKKHRDSYVQKVRIIQSLAFKKMEGKR